MAFKPAKINMRILRTIYCQEPLCGSDFFQKLDIAKRGTVYKTLKRMEEQGLLYSYEEQRRARSGGSLRRMYTLTAQGRHAVLHKSRRKRVENVVHPLFS